jgi:hypothetical protein
VALVLALIFALVPSPSHSATGEASSTLNQSQPYGGCKEAWQAPQSDGADWCRDHGWVVRKRIVVGPKNWVRYYTLNECAVEDASNGPVPCQWNLARPKSAGDDYWVTGSNEDPRYHYVKGVR